MRLESFALAFSLINGCPALDGDQDPLELDPETASPLDDLSLQQVPQIDDDPNPNPDDPTDLEEVEGIHVYQEFETTDTANEGEVCRTTYQTVGAEYDDKCNDCVFAFEVETKHMPVAGESACEPSEIDRAWLLQDYESADQDGEYGVENIRLQFFQTLETPDKVLTNVLVSVADYTEVLENTPDVEIWEETMILAHDESDIGRAGVHDGRVWWTLDDGVTRIMASGIFAP
jgi:hypothetical protein